MANGLTQWFEAKLLDHALKGTAYSQPTSIYVSLHSADPTDVGTTGEISGGSYARQGATSSFAAASEGNPASKASNADLTWTNMPACTVQGVSIWDNSTSTQSSNCLWQGTLTASKTVNGGDTFKILSGSLTCTLE
jgi:hypothetical protein